jgi:hypothetical protein
LLDDEMFEPPGKLSVIGELLDKPISVVGTAKAVGVVGKEGQDPLGGGLQVEVEENQVVLDPEAGDRWLSTKDTHGGLAGHHVIKGRAGVRGRKHQAKVGISVKIGEAVWWQRRSEVDVFEGNLQAIDPRRAEKDDFNIGLTAFNALKDLDSKIVTVAGNVRAGVE